MSNASFQALHLDTARLDVANQATLRLFVNPLLLMSNQSSSPESETAFVFTISQREVQILAERFHNRELTSDEMEHFSHRFENHLSWEFVVECIEDCLEEILE